MKRTLIAKEKRKRLRKTYGFFSFDDYIQTEILNYFDSIDIRRVFCTYPSLLKKHPTFGVNGQKIVAYKYTASLSDTCGEFLVDEDGTIGIIQFPYPEFVSRMFNGKERSQLNDLRDLTVFDVGAAQYYKCFWLPNACTWFDQIDMGPGLLFVTKKFYMKSWKGSEEMRSLEDIPNVIQAKMGAYDIFALVDAYGTIHCSESLNRCLPQNWTIDKFFVEIDFCSYGMKAVDQKDGLILIAKWRNKDDNEMHETKLKYYSFIQKMLIFDDSRMNLKHESKC